MGAVLSYPYRSRQKHLGFAPASRNYDDETIHELQHLAPTPSIHGEAEELDAGHDGNSSHPIHIFLRVVLLLSCAVSSTVVILALSALLSTRRGFVHPNVNYRAE
jgi:hypothetical protein